MSYSIYMKTTLVKIKTFFAKLLDFIPTKLPIGMTAAEAWASSILKRYGFPDNDSMRWALAVKVLHLGETDAYKAKRYFFLAMHKSAANQVASQIMQDLKAKQAAAIAAEAAAQAATTSAEATANTTVASDAPQAPAIKS